jgi:hypothetical protein
MAGTNALLGTARLNNFRLNYLSEALAQERRTKVGILLAGQDVRGRVRRGSVTIRDVINDAPNTATLALEAPPIEYAATVLADGAIAYWRLGDVTRTAHDQTGRGHTGTLVGGVTINQPGALTDGDRAMGFDGIVGTRIDIAAAPDLAQTGAITVEVWVKTALASQQGGIVEQTIGGAVNTSYLLYQEGASWVFKVCGAFGYRALTAPVEPADVNHWVHLVGVFNTGYLYLFKNGVAAASSYDATAAALTAGAGVFTIGHLGTSSGTRVYPFAGLIDEVAVYVLLGGDRIGAHYAARKSEAPALAQALRITIGVDDPVLLFNGELSQIALTYEGRPTQTIYHCAATDDTARANRRRPFGQWTNVSATVVAQQLIASFVPGFGTAFVQAGLPPVSVIFDGSEGMNRCLTQITNLIGGYWYFLDSQLHLFLSEPTDAPDPIDDTPQRFLNDPPITASSEMSQVRTRVYGRGHGEALLSAVLPGETIVPIASTVVFSTTGGQAICIAQVLTYTGRDLGGGGSLVGPGAGPSVAAKLTQASGAGMASGAYSYAYTNVTASGESLPGPIAAITVGSTTPPPAPTVGTPTIGSGPNPGGHLWAVTFMTGSGETTPGPTAPPTAPAVAIQGGAGLDVGAHDYVVTFITAIGETSPGPASARVTAFQMAAPITTPTVGKSTYAYYNPPPHRLTAGSTYRYGFTYVTASGETAMSPPSAGIVADAVYGVNMYIDGYFAGSPQPPGLILITKVNYYRSVNGGPFKLFQTASGSYQSPVYDLYLGDVDIAGAASPPAVGTAFGAWGALTNLPIGDANVTGRHLYRRFNGSGPFKSLDAIPNNTTTTYTDTAPNARLGAAAPAVNTAHLQRFPITVPLGPLVLARKIYRTAAGGSTLQLAATLADNSTTTWIDTVPDAALGAAAPGTNTATANQVALSGIAVGAASVSARKVYRTAVNGAQLRLLVTIADNTTLSYLDALTDAVLGANAPTGDTSGLTQPQGQVNAGSPTVPTASAGPFPPSGWVIIGTQLVRYTGITGNTLTGIPPSGIGALTTTVRYGDHILAAPVLLGVTVPGGALTAPAGALVNLWVQRDDLAAQAAMAATDGGDGIYEYLVSDERRSLPSLTAVCDAHLLAYKAPIATVAYATHDVKTRSGKPIAVDLVSPPIRGTLVIQDVTIDEINAAPGLAPRFVVTASSVRFSFDDLLRQLAGTLEV